MPVLIADCDLVKLTDSGMTRFALVLRPVLVKGENDMYYVLWRSNDGRTHWTKHADDDDVLAMIVQLKALGLEPLVFNERDAINLNELTD